MQHLNGALTKHFIGWQKSVLPKGVKPGDCGYAVHPGGVRLLDNFSKLITDHGVENGQEACKWSYKNLRLYGNLASAAIIFILNDVCRNTDKDYIYFVSIHYIFSFFVFCEMWFYYLFCFFVGYIDGNGTWCMFRIWWNDSL